jgi:CBS domain-containing protein
MAIRVKEIMNREVFSLHSEDSADDALADLIALGITGAPVVDAKGSPLGVLSLRDLAGRREGDTAGQLMTRPAAVVREQDAIAQAGRLLAETGYHRLVVIDGEGHAVGLVSALDVVRGLLGVPAVHPASFPHLDPELGLVWTDDQPLVAGGLEGAPDGPGLIVLVHGGAGVPERVVWAEAAHDVYARLTDMLSTPQADQPVLAYWLGRGSLRFRAAAVREADLRKQALQRLHQRVRPGTPASGGALRG